jgi:PAS domain S-box-containing protein
MMIALILSSLEALSSAESRVIRVGGENNLPVSSITSSGKAQGLFPEVFEDIARQEGWKFEYVPCNWSQCVDDLAKGKLDLLLATAHTPKRAEVFDFTNESLLSNWGCVYVPRGKKLDSILLLEGKRIAVVRNDTHALAFRKLLADFGKQATYVEVEKLEDVFKSIDHGDADAGIVNRLFGQKRIKDYSVDATPIVFNPIEIKFAVPKGKHLDLVAALDKHIAKQKNDHGSVYAKSFERWLNIEGPKPILPKWFWPAVTLAILTAILLIAGVVLLRYEVRRKTLALTIAKEEAEALQRLYSGTFDNAFQFLGLLTPDGRLVNANKASLDVIGMDKESVVGCLFWETPWWRHDPDQQQRLKNAIERCAKGEIIHFEVTNLDSMGNLHYVDFSIKPLRDNLGTIVNIIPEGRDVSQYKKVQNDLLQREQELQSLFMTAPIGIAYVKDRVLVKVNTAYATLYGYSQEELIGKSTRMLYASDTEFLEVGKEVYAHATAKGSVTIETRTVTKSGAILDILLSIAPVSPVDSTAGFVSTVLDVTEKKRAFAALEESEKRFQTIFDESPMMMSLYDALTGVYVDINKSYCEVQGITRDAIGMRPDEAGVVSPEEFQRVWEIFSRQGSLNQCELKAFGKGGAVIDLLFSARTIELFGKNYIIGVSENITDRKLAEKRLKESEAKFRNIFENAPIGIFQSLPNGRFLTVNGVYAEIFGYSSPDEMIESVADITNQLYVNPNQRLHILDKLNLVNSVTTNDVQVRRKDGCIIYVDLYMRAVRGIDDEVEQLEGFLVDVTERKKTEEIMLQSEKLAMVAGMAAGIAHEVNNPLGIISQHIQNIERRLSPSLPANLKVADELGLDLEVVQRYMRSREISEYMTSMLQAVRRASDIIVGMLQFSRQSDASQQFCSLNEVMEQSVKLASSDYDLRKKYDFKNITINREFDEQLPQAIMCITEIEQVFINILRNAAQAMFEAGTVNPSIALHTASADGYVVATIKDNGPGMSDDVRKHIFDPFFTTKAVGSGTGLGLSVSYTIVTKNHGGELSVESIPGQGACFTIRLPLLRKG